MTTQSSVQTFEGKIYVGFRKAYSQDLDVVKAITAAREVCTEAVKDGWCVTLQPIEYIYTPTYTVGQEKPVDGEPGAVIGIINYPRFPSKVENLKAKAIKLANNLLERLEQQRVTVVFTDETILVERVQLSTGKLAEK